MGRAWAGWWRRVQSELGIRVGASKSGLSQRRDMRRTEALEWFKVMVRLSGMGQKGECVECIPQSLLLPHTLRPGCAAEKSCLGRVKIP